VFEAEEKTADGRAIRLVAQWLVLIAGLVFGGAFVYGEAKSMLRNPVVFQLALNHFPATVGLPCAVLAALCVVIFLQVTAGPVEFEAIGFKFKGASGPIVLWVWVFLAMSVCIRLLW
jgi:hypothetical protein